MSKLAFTLIELLVVIIIVATLAAIAIPKFGNSTLKTRENALRANLKMIREAEDRCEADTGLTVRVQDLDNRVAPATGFRRAAMNSTWPAEALDASTWRGPYLYQIPFNSLAGNNTAVAGETNNPGIAWTHESRNPSQNFTCFIHQLSWEVMEFLIANGD